jgi:hypothetical protein
MDGSRRTADGAGFMKKIGNDIRQDLQNEQVKDVLRKAKPKPVNPVDPV